MASQILNTREEWRRELESLPSLEENDGKIPSVFLAHGRESSSFFRDLAYSDQ